MTYTLKPNGDYMYVMREPTQSERNYYISNGYEPPELDREHDRAAYMYARGETKPNYPMPAIRYQASWREAGLHDCILRLFNMSKDGTKRHTVRIWRS